jgi:hypothetical protein
MLPRFHVHVLLAARHGDPAAAQIQGPALQGPGRKFYWYPAKAALRSGEVTGTQWDDPNVGDTSTAVGVDTVASGESSFAGGQRVIASGLASFAYGRNEGTLIAQAAIAFERWTGVAGMADVMRTAVAPLLADATVRA